MFLARWGPWALPPSTSRDDGRCMSPSTRANLRLLLAVIVLLIPVLSACGDDDESATTSTTSSATTTTEGATSSSTTTTESTTTTTTTVSTSSTSTTTGSSTTAATRVVDVFFSTGDGTDCSEVSAFDRTVDASIGPALAAFQELVGGPTTDEETAGASSFFSSATSEAILSVSLTGGVLTVDLADIRAEISNAGTSCGSAAFTSSLNATAFQFPAVDKARYLFAGSCDDFGGFIQTDICEFERGG